MKPLQVLMTLVLVCVSCVSQAADTPRVGAFDNRVRTVFYNPHDVVAITVGRGVVTRVILEEGEQIQVAATGYSSRCSAGEDDWCIHAEPGSNQIFVRPRDKASSVNLELRTNRRDYSIQFQIQQQLAALSRGHKSTAANDAMFRVIFQYPPKAPAPAPQVATVAVRPIEVDPALAALLAAPLSSEAGTEAPVSPSSRLKMEPVQIVNANYTMQVLDGGEDAIPSTVFDDGKFTFFEFPGAKEVPAIFVVLNGQAARVNWHMQGPFVVVHRLARQFTLRLGGAVVGVFNESYDAVGRDAGTGTGSDAVLRDVTKVKR